MLGVNKEINILIKFFYYIFARMKNINLYIKHQYKSKFNENRVRGRVVCKSDTIRDPKKKIY